MHNFLWFGDNFHPFIIYAVFGTTIAYGLALMLIRLLRIWSPRERIWFYMLPLLIPFLTYVVGQATQLNSRCILVNGGAGLVGTLFLNICVWSTKLANLLLPLFVVSMLLGIVKAGVSIVACQRLAHQDNGSHPVRARVKSQLFKLCGQMQIAEPRLTILAGNNGHAFVSGFLKPVLILSEGLVNALDDEELEALLAHELGHLVRGDSFGNWFSVFLRDMLFFAPFVYWTFQFLLFEREKAADDLAVAATGKPLALGQALIKTWRFGQRKFWQRLLLDNFAPSPGFAKLKGGLEARVMRMLDSGETPLAYLDYRIANLIIILLTIPVLLFLC